MFDLKYEELPGTLECLCCGFINKKETVNKNTSEFRCGRCNGLIARVECDKKEIMTKDEKVIQKVLEKEIPKRVIKIEGASSQACPVCKNNVNFNYCPCCGQKLSYS